MLSSWKVFDPAQRGCRSTEEPAPEESAPEEEWGDFPLPNEYDAYA